jgi:hypothetical protein
MWVKFNPVNGASKLPASKTISNLRATLVRASALLSRTKALPLSTHLFRSTLFSQFPISSPPPRSLSSSPSPPRDPAVRLCTSTRQTRSRPPHPQAQTIHHRAPRPFRALTRCLIASRLFQLWPVGPVSRVNTLSRIHLSLYFVKFLSTRSPPLFQTGTPTLLMSSSSFGSQPLPLAQPQLQNGLNNHLATQPVHDFHDHTRMSQYSYARHWLRPLHVQSRCPVPAPFPYPALSSWYYRPSCYDCRCLSQTSIPRRTPGWPSCTCLHHIRRLPPGAVLDCPYRVPVSSRTS